MKLTSKNFLAYLGILLVIAGCASAQINQNRQVKTLQVLQRVDEFQDLVIELYNTKQISADRALICTKFTVSAAKIVKNAPSGWEPTVKQAWVEFKSQVPLDKMEPKLQLGAMVLDTLLMGLK